MKTPYQHENPSKDKPIRWDDCPFWSFLGVMEAKWSDMIKNWHLHVCPCVLLKLQLSSQFRSCKVWTPGFFALRPVFSQIFMITQYVRVSCENSVWKQAKSNPGIFPGFSRRYGGFSRRNPAKFPGTTVGKSKHFILPCPCHITMSHPSREFLYCRGQHMFPSIRWLKWLWFSHVVDGCHDYRLRADEYIKFSHLGWIQEKNKSNTNSSRGYQPDSCFWGVFSPKSWFLQENPLSAIWGFSLRNASLGLICSYLACCLEGLCHVLFTLRAN